MQKMPLLVHNLDQYEAVQTCGSLRLCSIDILNKGHIFLRSKAFPSRDFLLLNKLGPWAESFFYLLPLLGLCVVWYF
jgi:hypothetical protein